MRKGQISSHIHYCCCGYCRTAGRLKASTLSLSVLVAIEMFNAFNALSEDNSLLQLPPWSNPWLLVATCISLGLHCVILYIPFLAQVCYLGDLVWGFGVHGQLAMGFAWKWRGMHRWGLELHACGATCISMGLHCTASYCTSLSWHRCVITYGMHAHARREGQHETVQVV